jgi:hypothetical protein
MRNSFCAAVLFTPLQVGAGAVTTSPATEWASYPEDTLGHCLVSLVQHPVDTVDATAARSNLHVQDAVELEDIPKLG